MLSKSFLHDFHPILTKEYSIDNYRTITQMLICFTLPPVFPLLYSSFFWTLYYSCPFLPLEAKKRRSQATLSSPESIQYCLLLLQHSLYEAKVFPCSILHALPVSYCVFILFLKPVVPGFVICLHLLDFQQGEIF